MGYWRNLCWWLSCKLHWWHCKLCIGENNRGNSMWCWWLLHKQYLPSSVNDVFLRKHGTKWGNTSPILDQRLWLTITVEHPSEKCWLINWPHVLYTWNITIILHVCVITDVILSVECPSWNCWSDLSSGCLVPDSTGPWPFGNEMGLMWTKQGHANQSLANSVKALRQ